MLFFLKTLSFDDALMLLGETDLGHSYDFNTEVPLIRVKCEVTYMTSEHPLGFFILWPDLRLCKRSIVSISG